MKARRCCQLLLMLFILLLPACAGPEADLAGVSLGEVRVHVHDAAGAPLNQIAVQLRNPTGGLIEESRTGSFGTAGHTFFIIQEGSYRVQVVLPNGYAVAPGQANPTSVAVRRLEQATLHFTLVRE